MMIDFYFFFRPRHISMIWIVPRMCWFTMRMPSIGSDEGKWNDMYIYILEWSCCYSSLKMNAIQHVSDDDITSPVKTVFKLMMRVKTEARVREGPTRGIRQTAAHLNCIVPLPSSHMSHLHKPSVVTLLLYRVPKSSQRDDHDDDKTRTAWNKKKMRKSLRPYLLDIFQSLFYFYIWKDLRCSNCSSTQGTVFKKIISNNNRRDPPCAVNWID